MEGVQHPHGLREAVRQGGCVAPERVQRGRRDARSPGRVAAGEPLLHRGSGPAGDDVEQLRARPSRAGQRDDPGHELGARARTGREERGLVHADRDDPGQPCRIVDQRRAVVADGAHHRGPADAQRGRDRVYVLPVLADPAAGIAPDPLGQRRPRPQLGADLRPGTRAAGRLRAAPQALEPEQRHRPAARGQVPHPHLTPTMSHRHDAAGLTPGGRRGRLDRLLQLAVRLRHGQQPKAAEPEHGRTRTTVTVHRGPLPSRPRHRDLEALGLTSDPGRPTCRASPSTLHGEEPANQCHDDGRRGDAARRRATRGAERGVRAYRPRRRRPVHDDCPARAGGHRTGGGPGDQVRTGDRRP